MRREISYSCLAAVALALTGCGVQLQDQTPGKFPVNPEIGMYPITVKVTSGAMVSQPVYVWLLSDGQKVALSEGSDGTYQTMFPVKCTNSFPVQYLAVWRLQGVVTKNEVYPAQPRQIELTPPPPLGPAQAPPIDTSGKPDKKTHAWQGSVQFDVVTDANAHITSAQIEPVSQDKADVAAAKAISIVSGFPLDASCGIPTAVQLASKDRRAQANLVIGTDVPGIPQWTTKVVFAPSPAASQ